MTTATTTSSAAMASDTSMAGMHMEDGSCKTSMLWNWYTIDACFISSTWHITTTAMFAGSCIGVILLVMSLEFLRRTAKEYDRHILRQFQRSRNLSPPLLSNSPSSKSCSEALKVGGIEAVGGRVDFRPNLFQQAVRATLHMLQFAVAYFVMLLAMYYNGYIIVCIIIGAWLGAFTFNWETISVASGPQEEATMCCG